MRFRPSKDERDNGHQFGDTAVPSDLMDSSLYISGSNWSKRHLDALKIASIDNLEPSRIIPPRFIPSNHLDSFVELASAFSKPSHQELRTWSKDTSIYLENNKFHQVFTQLNSAMGHESELFDNLSSPVKIPVASSETSQSSHSSHEDKPEASSRKILECIMDILALEVSRFSTKYMVSSYSQDIKLWLLLGPDRKRPDMKTVSSDGGWCLRKTAGGGHGHTPLVSYEAKRRHVNKTVRHTGQAEKFQEDSLAQELAELLGIAVAGY